eukprot:5707016-Prymnesium_polylepis.1
MSQYLGWPSPPPASPPPPPRRPDGYPDPFDLEMSDSALTAAIILFVNENIGRKGFQRAYQYWWAGARAGIVFTGVQHTRPAAPTSSTTFWHGGRTRKMILHTNETKARRASCDNYPGTPLSVGVLCEPAAAGAREALSLEVSTLVSSPESCVVRLCGSVARDRVSTRVFGPRARFAVAY